MAVLTLTLGITGNNVIFSVISATFLRPLPYPDPQELVILQLGGQGDVSSLAFFAVRNRVRKFSHVTAFYPVEVGVNLSAMGKPQYVRALSVSKDFFPVLGIRPELGNSFGAEQDEPNAPRTVILSHGLWVERFNQDQSVVGREELRVNGESCRIIGVMPRGFHSYPDADIWLPLQLNPASSDPGNNYRVIGRLTPGASREQAQYELDALSQDHKLSYLPSLDTRTTLVVRGLQEFLVRREREGLTILFAAVGFVFLIACSNVAVLILVRAAANVQTIAIRAALGPSKLRLLFSLLSESLLLSGMAGVLGLILAKESLPLLRYLWPSDLPLMGNLSIDGRVALFTLALVIGGPLLFGLVPALKLSRVNVAQLLAHTSRTISAGAEQIRTLRFLVAGQLALTVMLLAGTVLLMKGLLNLHSVALGFDPNRLIVAQVSLAGDRYSRTAPTARMLDEVVKRLEAVPGVDGVAAMDGLPLESGLNVPLHPLERPESLDHADEYRPVTSNYFKTMGVRLESGRFFSDADTAGSAPVAIVNETMARRWWPGAPAIGQFVKVGAELGPEVNDPPREIVGVVSDVRERGPATPPSPTIFVPINQIPDNMTAFFNKTFLSSIVIRSSRRGDLSLQVGEAVHAVDPDLPLASIHPFREVLERMLANQRFIVTFTAVFGAFALILAIIGIQGLLTYQVRLRRQEIAVRMAVGASHSDIIGMVMRQGASLIGTAIILGVGGSFIIRKVLSNLLYNVQSTSNLMIGATGLLLGLIATLISLRAGVQAASIEPMAVLRNE